MAGRHQELVWTQRTGPALSGTRPTDVEETNPYSGWPQRAISIRDIMNEYKDYHVRLVQAWGSNAPSDHTVFHCFRQFQPNKFSVQVAPRSGRPSTSLTQQTIDVVRKIIEDNSHSTYQQIEAILGISSKAIDSIIYDYLHLRKVCARWVPHILAVDQKQLRLQFCRHSLKRFEEARSRCVFDIITGDESYFYHYDPELKQQ